MLKLAVLFTAAVVAAPVTAQITAPESEPNEFHFVVLGDAQFHDPAGFNRIIDQTAQLAPAFVVQVGDLIEGYNANLDEVRREWQRFDRQVQPLGDIPYFAVAGNHDIYGGNKRPDAKLERLFAKQFGALYYTFSYKNAQFYVLSSDSSEAMNRVSGKQLAWFKQALAESDAQHKFVFMHRPAFLLANADEMHDLYVKHNVRHVIYGHHHHYHHTQRDGVTYTMTNSTATSAHDEAHIGGFDHLLQISVRGDDVKVAVIAADAVRPADAVAPEDNYDYFALVRGLAPPNVDLQKQGERRFSMTIPLNNTSDRDIELFIDCDSDDHRWHFNPQLIAPLQMASKSSRRLTLTTHYESERVPESQPACRIRVPYQTSHGKWIEFNDTVVGIRP